MMAADDCYIGLMSGTSLDGVDGVLVYLPPGRDGAMQVLASSYIPFDPAIRQLALQLQQPSEDEIHHEALLANRLAQVYAACIRDLQGQAPDVRVIAAGVHGQTIRHRPELGYTWQVNNPALLAELTGIDVIADFRSRDIAAGGQGAPLVPAFHHAIFAVPEEVRVVANIGGISNISILDPSGTVSGFDTGPGNVLMDYWNHLHCGTHYDANGTWAAQGEVLTALLENMMAEPYLQLPPPKSTGRDLFHAQWLQQHLQVFEGLSAVDVQATLCAYTANTLAQAILAHAAQAGAVYVCGGGAFNNTLMCMLQNALRQRASAATVASTAQLGVAPEHVESLAFAWLAQQFCSRQAGNLPAVTGAQGGRILGALYPA
jgi:anhydro-N-acetylmuramic acid kinase